MLGMQGAILQAIFYHRMIITKLEENVKSTCEIY